MGTLCQYLEETTTIPLAEYNAFLGLTFKV